MVTMPIISRAYEVWERLYARYSLEPGAPPITPPQLATWILPVTQADELLQKTKGAADRADVTGNGVVTVYTVPAGKRWTLHNVLVNTASGTFKESSFRLYDASEDVEAKIAAWTAATTYHVDPAIFPLTVNEYDQIRTEIEAHSVNGQVLMYLWYTESDAY